MKKLISLVLILTFCAAVFAPAVASAASFTDLTDAHWAYDNIMRLANDGTINGYDDGTFLPEGTVTRAEFVKILNNVFGLTKSSGIVFTDTENHWAKNEIDIAVTNGVCKGKSTTEFKPNDSITREEAA